MFSLTQYLVKKYTELVHLLLKTTKLKDTNIFIFWESAQLESKKVIDQKIEICQDNSYKMCKIYSILCT